jgi:hypothetical protein
MLNKLTFGKICEYQIISELLREGFEVFIPTIDDRGIDCIIRNKKGKFIEIQIKGRQPRDIFNIKSFIPKDNYFFVLIPPDQKIYIVPSFKIAEWLKGRPKFNLSKHLRTEYESKYSLLNT